MKKPEKEKIEYYDWDSAWNYIKEKYNFCEEVPEEENDENDEPGDVWNYICDSHEMHNGKIFTISDWELIHDNGKFAYLVPKWYQPILRALMEEFGEADTGCTTKGVKTANFRSNW